MTVKGGGLTPAPGYHASISLILYLLFPFVFWFSAMKQSFLKGIIVNEGELCQFKEKLKQHHFLLPSATNHKSSISL